MAYYKKPKHINITEHFNPLDFATKEETEAEISITDVMAPPIVDEGITFIKSDLLLHTNPNFIFDDDNSRLGIGTNNPLTTLHVQGNSTLAGDVGASGTVTAGALTVNNISNLQKTAIKSTFNTLVPTGAIVSCSTLSDYPVVIQSTDDTKNVTKAALAFGANSNSSSVPSVSFDFTRTADTPARGKLDVNVVNATTKDTVTSFQNDRVIFSKSVGVMQPGPLSAMHVTGDIIGTNLALGTNAVPLHRLHFGTTAEAKICLYPGSVPATSFYGIGVGGSATNYQIPDTSTSHQFRQGGKNNDGSLLMTIKGTGQIGIGTTVTPGKLTFNNTDEKKITFKSTDGVKHTGLETSNRLVYSTNRETLEYHLQNTEAEHQFWATNSAGVQRFLMKVHYSEQDSRSCVYIGNDFAAGRNYALELQQDSAYKAGGQLWSLTSDERIKENIQIANYDVCYENIKNLDLKRYKYKDFASDGGKINDKTICGWIAQEVEKIYPKAVKKTERFKEYGIEDCLDIQADQIYACLYGCVKKLMQKVETLETEMSDLKKLVI